MPKGIYPRKTLATRFWAKVEKGPGCWVWTGLVGSSGYGLIRLGFGAATLRLQAMCAATGDGHALREKLKTAEADNARARDLAAKKVRALEGAALAKQYAAISDSIDGIDAKKRKMVAAMAEQKFAKLKELVTEILGEQ